MSDSRDPRNNPEIFPMLPVPENQKESQGVSDDFIDMELDGDEDQASVRESLPYDEESAFKDPDHDTYGSFDDITDSVGDRQDSYDFDNQNSDLSGVDEDGIFADPNQEKPTKKGASSAGIALLVIIIIFGGLAGYSYYAAPQIFKQFPDHFSLNEWMRSFGIGAGSAGSVAKNDSTAVETGETKDQTVGAQSSDTAKNPAAHTPDQTVQSRDIPPQPKPIAAETPPELGVNKSGSAQNSAAVGESAAAKSAVGEDVPVPSLGASSVDPKDQKLVAETNTKIFHPKTQEVDITKIIDDLGNDKVKNPEKNLETNATSSAAKSVSSGDSKETTQKTVGATATASRASPFDELEKDEEENKIYDSPPGDLFAKMPAPSLNPQRGANSSIIVVQKAGDAKAQKNYSDAEKVSIEATSLDRQLVAGSRAVKLGMYDAAAKIYDDLYRKNPRDIGTLMGRAVLFQKTGERARAIESYEAVLELTPDNTEAIINLAGLIRKDQPAVALEKLLNLREKYPNNVAIAAQLGVSYADAGNLVDAYKYLDLAASLEPRNPLHYFNQAVVADRAGDKEKAIGLYEKALEIDAIYGTGRAIPRDQIYDRLSHLRS